MVFSGINLEGDVAPPDFLRSTLAEGIMCGFLHESPMQFDGTTKLHRKSGFGLHQLRNRSNGGLQAT